MTQIVGGERSTDEVYDLSSTVFSEEWRDSDSDLLPHNVLAIEASWRVVKMADPVMVHVDHFAVVVCYILHFWDNEGLLISGDG